MCLKRSECFRSAHKNVKAKFLKFLSSCGQKHRRLAVPSSSQLDGTVHMHITNTSVFFPTVFPVRPCYETRLFFSIAVFRQTCQNVAFGCSPKQVVTLGKNTQVFLQISSAGALAYLDMHMCTLLSNSLPASPASP